MLRYNVVICLLLYVNTVKSDIDYKLYVPNCHTKNVDFNECIHKSLQNAISASQKGFPELKIDQLDPYKMPDFSIRNPIGLSAKLTNINSTGISKTVVRDIRLNVKEYRFDLFLTVPHLRLIGNYELTGKLVTLPVRAFGNSDSSLHNLQCSITIQGERYKSTDDKLYMKIKRVNTTINNAKKVTVYIDRPFNNNKELNNLVNHFLNDNWEELFNTYKPDLENIISQNVYNVSEKYFSQIPYKFVFTD